VEKIGVYLLSLFGDWMLTTGLRICSAGCVHSRDIMHECVVEPVSLKRENASLFPESGNSSKTALISNNILMSNQFLPGFASQRHGNNKNMEISTLSCL
jgi:hypothetical protein